MVSLSGQPEKTIQITDELITLNEKHPGTVDLDDIIITKYSQAEAYAALSKWNDAEKIYKSLLWDYEQCRRGPSSLFFSGRSQTLYELQKYDEAIEMGNIAVKMIRHKPEVHKYLALSHKEKGDIDEAKKTISRAILYECHWDKDNLQKNKQLLRELNSL